MKYEFNKILMDARNLTNVASTCALVKLENDMVSGEPKGVLCDDLEMLSALLDTIAEKLDLCLDDVA